MPDVFQILADPTRRRLVDALRGGERSVTELVDAVDIGQPGVSRQLGILEDARFVVVRPEGRRRLYRFAAELDRRGRKHPKHKEESE
jgi:DNA-binding transcriptional ArsR family regulator